MRRALLLLAVPALAALLSCVGSGDTADRSRERVLLVTTTSVEASGLLDELAEAYHSSQDRYRLAATAVGSGAALQMGRRGDADVLLTHDPAGEAAFAAEGLAAKQGPVMMNHFLVIGPAEDPAGIRSSPDAARAFAAIAESGASFVSRGDDSGTHAREREIWREAGFSPWEERPGWYVEAGTGMGETLQMANQVGAYTLADRGTFLHLRDGLRVEPLLSSEPALENHYTFTLPMNAATEPGARDFIEWLTGPGQDVIGRYGVPRFGEPLFGPTAARAADGG